MVIDFCRSCQRAMSLRAPRCTWCGTWRDATAAAAWRALWLALGAATVSLLVLWSLD